MSHQDLRRPGVPGYDLRFEHSATAVIYATGFVPRARRVPDLADRIGPGDPRSRSARHRLLDPSSVCAAHRIADLRRKLWGSRQARPRLRGASNSPPGG